MVTVSTGLPPGPHLDDAQLDAFERDPVPFLETFHADFGDLFTVFADGRPPRVYISDPDLLGKVFVDHDLPSAGSSHFAPVVGPDALPLLSGDEHRRLRRLLTPPLLGRRLRGYAAAIVRITEDAVGTYRGRGTVPLIEMTREITLRVIIRVVFGDIPAPRATRVYEIVTALMDVLRQGMLAQSTEPRQTLLGRLAEHCEALEDFVREEIERGTQHPAGTPDTMLGHILEHGRKHGCRTDASGLRGQIAMLLIAGHETTSSALGWSLYLVSQDPARHRRLTSEVATAQEDPHKLAALPLVDAVCRETLRWAAVVPTGIARRTLEPVEIGGHFFPAGTEFVSCIHLAHRRPERYPDAQDFTPERFLDSTYRSVENLPFGLGTHRCLGAQLAEFEMRIALGRILALTGLRVSAPAGTRPLAVGPSLTLPDDVLIDLTTDAGPSASE
ncbi:cytochrome P450 [Streptomyces sp. NPDC002523]